MFSSTFLVHNTVGWNDKQNTRREIEHNVAENDTFDLKLFQLVDVSSYAQANERSSQHFISNSIS